MPEAATSQQPETMGVIYRMPTSELHPHPDNPFGVRDDPEMQELVDSVQKFGVLVPAIARPRPDGGFELISGHRRKHASELAGLDFMPVIVLIYWQLCSIRFRRLITTTQCNTTTILAALGESLFSFPAKERNGKT